MNKKKYKLLAFGALIFFIGLLVYSYLGIYTRLWSDDWCYNANFSTIGFWKTFFGYSSITAYASNRFSLTLFSGFFYYLGIPGLQILPALHIGLLVIGLYKSLVIGFEILNTRLSKRLLLLFSLIVVYYSIYLAPHLYQSFYFRSAVLPYTTPLVISLWLIYFILQQVKHRKSEKSTIFWVGLLSFFAGGFSEAGAAYLVTLIAFIFFLVIYGS